VLDKWRRELTVYNIFCDSFETGQLILILRSIDRRKKKVCMKLVTQDVCSGESAASI